MLTGTVPDVSEVLLLVDAVQSLEHLRLEERRVRLIGSVPGLGVADDLLHGDVQVDDQVGAHELPQALPLALVVVLVR